MTFVVYDEQILSVDFFCLLDFLFQRKKKPDDQYLKSKLDQ